MQLEFAPMEGITNNRYRRMHALRFGGVDRYYTWFLSPVEDGLAGKTLREVLPENNEGICLIPQVLTNHADGFLRVCEKLQELGYTEVNFNLGCPSGTVVSKSRGSGFLAHLEELEQFLDEVFEKSPIDISIKTRLGMKNAEEFEQILELYNRYPLKSLIIHPRVREDYYRNHANRAAFAKALAASKAPVCYNGDLFTVTDVEQFQKEFPTVERIMLGRGLVANPALARMAKGGADLTAAELKAFHDDILKDWSSLLSGPKDVMCHMKGQWGYWGGLFEDSRKQLKRIQKSSRLPEYQQAVEQLFAGCKLNPKLGYTPREQYV